MYKTNSKLLGSHSPSTLTVRSRSCVWPQCSVVAAVAMDVLRLFCYIFAHEFLFNPHFDLEPDYVIRKGIRHRIQQYTVRMETLPIFHTRLSISRPMSVYPYVAIVKYWTKMPNNARNHARNSPFPLRHVDFFLTRECLGPPHSPRQTTAQSLYALPHNDATKSPLVTMGRRKFTPKQSPFPFDDHH